VFITLGQLIMAYGSFVIIVIGVVIVDHQCDCWEEFQITILNESNMLKR